MYIFQGRLKVFCDRVMSHFVESLLSDRNCLLQSVSDTNKSVLCVIQYPKSHVKHRTASTTSAGVAVPVTEVFPKLEQVVMFLTKPFGDVILQVKGEDGHQREPKSLIRYLGSVLCKRLFESIYKDCLVHTIPQDGSDNFEQFNNAITLSEQFQTLLTSLDFLPVESAGLLDHFNNVSSLFANLKSQEVLKKAHELMLGDMVNSVHVSTDLPLGRQRHHSKKQSTSESLLPLIVSWRQQMGVNSQKIPPLSSQVRIAYLFVKTFITNTIIKLLLQKCFYTV